MLWVKLFFLFSFQSMLQHCLHVFMWTILIIEIVKECFVDLEKKNKVTKDNILYFCGWSPFEGYEFKGEVSETILNGEIAYSNGLFKSQSPIGMQVEFDR